jgi:hypothetical protein
VSLRDTPEHYFDVPRRVQTQVPVIVQKADTLPPPPLILPSPIVVDPNMLLVLGLVTIVGLIGLFALLGSNKKCDR